jgi:hypothetical protein
MEDDRIIGCLPGETPASILLIHQERRHRAALAAALARAEAAERLAERDRPRTNLEDQVSIIERQLAAMTARAESAEKMAIWSVREDCRVVGQYLWQVKVGYIKFDGSDADLLRALKEARGVE